MLGVSYSSPIVALPRPCDPSLIKAGSVQLHSRVRIAEAMMGQSLPLQVQGPKPAHLQNVQTEPIVGDDGQPVAQKPPQQSFLRKYVSVSALSFLCG